jgi:hypothetical protein
MRHGTCGGHRVSVTAICSAGRRRDSVSSVCWPPCPVPPTRYGQPEGGVVDRRTFLRTVTGSLLTAPIAAEAQQAGEVPRIIPGLQALAQRYDQAVTHLAGLSPQV